MVKSNILFELLFEDIPYNDMVMGFDHFKSSIINDLSEEKLTYTAIDLFFTRNRFIVNINGLIEKQDDIIVEIAGPPRDVCYKNNEPTPALLGFCRKNNIEIKSIVFKEKKGKEYVFIKKEIKGKYSIDILKDLLKSSIISIPFKRKMNLDNMQNFIRPIRGMIFLKDDELVPFKIYNIGSYRFI